MTGLRAPGQGAYGIPKDDPNRDAILEEATVTAAPCPCTSWSCAARPWIALPFSPPRAAVWLCPDAGTCAAVLQQAALRLRR